MVVKIKTYKDNVKKEIFLRQFLRDKYQIDLPANKKFDDLY